MFQDRLFVDSMLRYTAGTYNVCKDCNQTDEYDCTCNSKTQCNFCKTHKKCINCNKITCMFSYIGDDECKEPMFLCDDCNAEYERRKNGCLY